MVTVSLYLSSRLNIVSTYPTVRVPCCMMAAGWGGHVVEQYCHHNGHYRRVLGGKVEFVLMLMLYHQAQNKYLT